jgi:hypothetical protein
MEKEAGNLSSRDKSYKTFLIAGLVVVIIVLMSLIARFVVESFLSATSQKMIDSSLFKVIKSKQDSFIGSENISTLAEAQSVISRNRDYVQNQISDLKTTGKMEVFILNRTVICEDGRRISPEDIFNRGGCYQYNSSFLRSEGEGYIKISANSSKALILISASSQMILLYDYAYYMLDQNQKNPKNTEDSSARVLDMLNYLAKKISTVRVFKGVFTKFNESTDAREVIIKADSFARNLEMPSEQEIDNSPIKDSCVNSFNSVIKSSNSAFEMSLKSSILEKVFFLGRSINRICGYLEKYQKDNAKKILKSLDSEQNPLVIIDDKTYLNLLTRCGSEWFYYNSTSGSTGEECQNKYLEDLESRFSAAVK